MKAEEILAIPDDRPELLFGYDLDGAKTKYRLLTGEWHPDRNKDGSDVFAKIAKLYEAVQDVVAKGVWRGDKFLWFRSMENKEFTSMYLASWSSEVCEMYVSNGYLTQIVKSEYSDLVDRAHRMIDTLKFASEKMELEMMKYLPMKTLSFKTFEHRVLVQPKNGTQLPLRILLERMGGRVPSQHVAWILSTAYNNACYFDAYMKWVHGGFSVDNYFVCPEKHEGGPLAGWWYVTRRGERPKALPAATVRLLPKVRNRDYVASYEIDSLGIKTMGLELLGDRNGSKLLSDRSIPAPMLQWLRSPPMDSAVKEYHVWKESVLPKSFGKPKFVELDINASKLYEVT